MSDLVRNPIDRFSRDKAQIMNLSLYNLDNYESYSDFEVDCQFDQFRVILPVPDHFCNSSKLPSVVQLHYSCDIVSLITTSED